MKDGASEDCNPSSAVEEDRGRHAAPINHLGSINKANEIAVADREHTFSIRKLYPISENVSRVKSQQQEVPYQRNLPTINGTETESARQNLQHAFDKYSKNNNLTPKAVQPALNQGVRYIWTKTNPVPRVGNSTVSLSNSSEGSSGAMVNNNDHALDNALNTSVTKGQNDPRLSHILSSSNGNIDTTVAKHSLRKEEKSSLEISNNLDHQAQAPKGLDLSAVDTTSQPGLYTTTGSQVHPVTQHYQYNGSKMPYDWSNSLRQRIGNSNTAGQVYFVGSPPDAPNRSHDYTHLYANTAPLPQGVSYVWHAHGPPFLASNSNTTESYSGSALVAATTNQAKIASPSVSYGNNTHPENTPRLSVSNIHQLTPNQKGASFQRPLQSILPIIPSHTQSKFANVKLDQDKQTNFGNQIMFNSSENTPPLAHQVVYADNRLGSVPNNAISYNADASRAPIGPPIGSAGVYYNPNYTYVMQEQPKTVSDNVVSRINSHPILGQTNYLLPRADPSLTTQLGVTNEMMFANQGEKIEVSSLAFPHRCHLCPKLFKRKSWLKRHLLSHSQQRHFLCPWCNSRHKRRDNLLQHMKLKHVPNLLQEINSRNMRFNWPILERLSKQIDGTIEYPDTKTLIHEGLLNKDELKNILNTVIDKHN